MATAAKNLLAGQDRYKSDFDKRIRLPTPDYQAGDQVLVNPEAAPRSEGRTDKDRVNNKLAPRTEGLFPVVKVDDHTVTVLRGMGLKDRIYRESVVKSTPRRNAVEDATPLLAYPRNDGETPSSGMSPGRGEHTVEQAMDPPRDNINFDDNARYPAPSDTRALGILDAVTSGILERVILRLAPLPPRQGRHLLPQGVLQLPRRGARRYQPGKRMRRYLPPGPRTRLGTCVNPL